MAAGRHMGKRTEEEDCKVSLNLDSQGGPGYIGAGWYIIAPPGGTLLLRRLQNIRGSRILSQISIGAEATFAGHLYVQQNQLRFLFDCNLVGSLTIRSLDNLPVNRLQNSPDKVASPSLII